MSAIISGQRGQLGTGRRWPSSSAFRVLEHDLLVFRRSLRSQLLTGMVQPLLYLLSIGIGLGAYVNGSGGAALGRVSYLIWVGPALLIAQAMMTAAFESTYPILSKFQWQRTYWAALNTPLGALDLLAGDLLWIALRLALLSTLFLGAMALLGAVGSPLAIVAVPVAVLTGMAFATPLVAFTATQRRDSAFMPIFRFGITPLFLFSGTFFPIEQLPLVVRPIAWITPLYHGVSLGRGLALDNLDLLEAAIHLAVLVTFVVAGLVAGSVTYRRRLEV
jgi:lipooligosaccharide transport system permease protein